MNKPSPEFDGFDPGQPAIGDLDFQAVTVADGGLAADTPAARTAHPLLALLGRCISRLSDSVLITEAEPLDHPGPRIVFVNEAFERQTGYSMSEVVGLSPRILQGPKTDPVELRRLGTALRRWEAVRAELVNYTKDNREFWVEVDIVPIADATGFYTHWVSIQRDVTARKRNEASARTREVQQTESIGTLALGIAHDFNNIIAAILGNVAIGRQDVADGKTALPALEQIDIAAMRARGLVRQILAYGRRQPQVFVRQPLAAVVHQAVDLLRATLPAGVGLTLKVRDPTLEVLADATQLQQVLLNLGTNAWHAMRGSPGQIGIEVGRLVIPGRPMQQQRSTDTPNAAEHYGLVTLVDNGCGMDEETRLRIFEPYFTTKPIGQGTGLGLAVVWGIVSTHGGTINVESEVGKGTSVSLVFPLLPESVVQPMPEIAVAAPRKATGQRVMVIDDDEVVLQVFRSILSVAGFDVRPFADPRQALEILRLEPAAFDVVVTDLNMPELSGLQFAAAVTGIRADLPVVLGSGFVGDELTGIAMNAGIAAVFRKEEATEHLSGVLLDVLAAATESAEH